MTKNRFKKPGTAVSTLLQRSLQFSGADLSPAGPAVMHLPVELLVPNPRQPRRSFDEAGLGQLAESIRERGVLQPLLVRPLEEGRYEIVYGERRWRAARRAGLEAVPVMVRALEDEEAEIVAAVENLQREDLNRYDEVTSKLMLIARLFGTTAEEAVQLLKQLRSDPSSDPQRVSQLETLFTQLGREQWISFVTNGLPALNLPELLVQAVQSGELEYSKALLISRASAEHHTSLLQQALGEQLTHAELRERVARLKAKPTAGMDAAIQQLRKKMSSRRLDKLPLERRTRAEALIRELNDLLEG